MNLSITLAATVLSTAALLAIVRRILHEGRVVVVAPLAAGLNLVAVSLALLWFGRAASFALVLGVLAGLIVAAGVVVRVRGDRAGPPWSWGLSPAATAGYLALGLFIGAGTLALWSGSVWGGTSHENLFQHTGLAAMLAREPSELRHPLEPDHALVYRVGFHYAVAGYARVAGLGVPTVMQVIVLAAALIGVAALFGAVLRSHRPRIALLASLLFFAGGPVSYLIGVLPPSGPGDAVDRVMRVVERLPAGATQPGPLGQMAQVNGSFVFGYMIGAVALALYVEVWRAHGTRRWVLAVAAGLALGALGAAFESLWLALVAAVGVDLLRRGATPGRAWWTRAGPAFVVLGILGLTVVSTTGLLGGDAAAGATRDRLGAQFAGALAGQAPTVALAAQAPDQIAARLAVGDGWMPMWSPAFWFDVGFTPLLAVAALLWCARRGRLLGGLLALAALASFAVTATVTLTTYPWDTFRFTQAGMVLGYAAAGIAAGDALAHASRAWRRRGWAMVAGLAVIACGGLLASALVWPDLAARREGADYAMDAQLTSALVARDPTARVLVAPGATDWFGLHRHGDEAITKYVVAYGAVVPMGHDWYGNVTAYAEPYAVAYRTFDRTALDRLRIAYLYLAPYRLSPAQRAGLAALQSSGRVTLVDAAGAGATRREVYRLLPRPGAA